MCAVIGRLQQCWSHQDCWHHHQSLYRLVMELSGCCFVPEVNNRKYSLLSAWLFLFISVLSLASWLSLEGWSPLRYCCYFCMFWDKWYWKYWSSWGRRTTHEAMDQKYQKWFFRKKKESKRFDLDLWPYKETELNNHYTNLNKARIIS